MRFIAKQSLNFLKYFIFWMIFFLLEKVIFLLYNSGLTTTLTNAEIIGVFFHGLKMDVSTACYILLIPCLLSSFHIVIPLRFLNRTLNVFTVLFLIIITILAILDLMLYPHWGTRISVVIFNYINDSVALKASISIVNILVGLFLTGIVVIGFYAIYRRVFPIGVVVNEKVNWVAFLVQLFLTSALILPIRGGLDRSPLNLSSVAFSEKLYVNQSASNYLWNFINSVDKIKKYSNPCVYMPKEESIRLFNEFMESDSIIKHPSLIKVKSNVQPNVILIILESFSNKVLASFGGLKDITPNIDSICRKSILFTSFYATGNRSDRGLSAIMAGYPSLLSTAITNHPEKIRKLTLLSEYFKRQKYFSSFYYGGDINFYNLRSTVLKGNYDRVVTKSDFPSELGRLTKWGVPDGYVFTKALEDLKKESKPFMQTIYTTSSHQPFDVPYTKIKGNSIDDRYLNAVAYSDSCVGEFIRGLKQNNIWENTLLIITADHGTPQPGDREITDPEAYRIPLIWTGGLIDSAQVIKSIAKQTDLLNTLIHQLGWETDYSRFSKDFFTTRPCAFYMLDIGWGYLTPEGNYFYDQSSKDFTVKPKINGAPVNLSYSKAYLQVLHDDFLSR